MSLLKITSNFSTPLPDFPSLNLVRNNIIITILILILIFIEFEFLPYFSMFHHNLIPRYNKHQESARKSSCPAHLFSRALLASRSTLDSSLPRWKYPCRWRNSYCSILSYLISRTSFSIFFRPQPDGSKDESICPQTESSWGGLRLAWEA